MDLEGLAREYTTLEQVNDPYSFSHLTSETPLDDVLNVLDHVWPIVMLLGHQVGLVFTKVTHQRPSMDPL